jgi:serine/threonine protein kinase
MFRNSKQDNPVFADLSNLVINSVIGRIYHMNLVRVCGVCSKRKHQLLVYEYVEDGSLAMLLFGNNGLPQWNQRYKIAVDVAKGLAYLHQGCLDRIIHCDVKPENILLDEDFDPKISDFGEWIEKPLENWPIFMKIRETGQDWFC